MNNEVSITCFFMRGALRGREVPDQTQENSLRFLPAHPVVLPPTSASFTPTKVQMGPSSDFDTAEITEVASDLTRKAAVAAATAVADDAASTMLGSSQIPTSPAIPRIKGKSRTAGECSALFLFILL